MPNLTVRNIPKEVYALLKKEAKRQNRSLNAEVLAILADKAEMARRRANAAKAMAEIDRIREEIAEKYPNQPDSVELLREDRYGP